MIRSFFTNWNNSNELIIKNNDQLINNNEIGIFIPNFSFKLIKIATSPFKIENFDEK